MSLILKKKKEVHDLYGPRLNKMYFIYPHKWLLKNMRFYAEKTTYSWVKKNAIINRVSKVFIWAGNANGMSSLVPVVTAMRMDGVLLPSCAPLSPTGEPLIYIQSTDRTGLQEPDGVHRRWYLRTGLFFTRRSCQQNEISKDRTCAFNTNIINI